MCLLTFIKQGGTIDLEDLRNGADYNPDGFGFAVHTGSGIITGHGMDFEKVINQFDEVRRIHNGHALFHSRITTHGNTDVSNCHPFRVGGDNLTVLGHNGMLPISVPKGDKRSDTNIFASEYLPNLGGVYALDDPKVRGSLEKWAKGSKLVVLTADRHANSEYYILNENDGHWEGDVWWSNYSYCYRPTPVVYNKSSFSSYGGWNMGAYTVPRVPKDDIDPGYWRDIYDDDDDDVYFGDIYEVECPLCGHTEMYDLMDSDPTACECCGNCMWCGFDDDKCRCWDNDSLQYEPHYRKVTNKELADWANATAKETMYEQKSGGGYEQSDIYQA
jgi:glutamine amidotransferase